ncbi:LOW QUALITY PROTEIN: cadherin-like protein 26 [Trematomus bernacchii]|uniref:LOW QUALITY PROTEIN: cadherin-like protein 26 n=1 Tax=Trematomus bernacchii TaxID=40690 RepID=UPI00146B0086|nr:LOW QUALITY PROTEIN: cadherin-like protein 26 [Trematomus bernacchii]
MRTCSLLLLVAFIALTESFHGRHHRRDKRELLVRAKRRWVLSTIEIQEEDSGPFPKEISQMFNDQTHTDEFFYEITGNGVTEKPMGVFKINEINGSVYALKPIDRETDESFHIKFNILSKADHKTIDKQLAFDVEIKDINDNAPIFLQSKMDVGGEGKHEGRPLANLKAVDKDQSNTINSTFTFSLEQEPKEPKIELKQVKDVAHLTFKGCFDYDKVKKYDVIVQAKDHGDPSLSSTAFITLNIIDTNTHAPTFRQKKYQGEVSEMITKNDILRIAVDDKDTPNTAGWRAKYIFMKGNEDGNYQIDTDPVTNEGILSVIKGKDFEKTEITYLLVEVENDEPLTLCKDNKLVGASEHPPRDIVNITMKVIDVNDAPVYEKNIFHLYLKEEEPPGKEIFTPKITDVDSVLSKVRHVLLEDQGKWMTIDAKTGTITTAKIMDRESEFVDENSVYKIVLGAIDDDEPPATGSCTVLIHLKDINDNKPMLANNSAILCGNKANKVMVTAMDDDVPPFSGPFTFSLVDDDKTVTERWKLDPSFGAQAGLISQTPLPYDNYSVPLLIRDQQNEITSATMVVMVCDCGEGVVCKPKDPVTSNLGKAGIGLLFLGLLLFLLLLFLLACQCKKKDMVMVQDEGNQTLIKYNQEGGGSACQAEPTLLLTPTRMVNNAPKMNTIKTSEISNEVVKDTEFNNSRMVDMINVTSLGSQQPRNTFASSGLARHNTWNVNRTNTRQGSSSMYQRSVSLRSNQHIADHIDRRLYTIYANQLDQVGYPPHEYAYEGLGSKSPSLDELSLSNQGDDMIFLDDLGPKFKTLAGICRPTIQEKNKL